MNKVAYNACYGGFNLSKKAYERLIALGATQLDNSYLSIDYYRLPDDVSRHDPRLIQVIEELGDEANGMCAKLCIEEIEGERYRISEYDGNESVKTDDDSYDWVQIK